MNAATVTTSPSLALIKYWGKSDREKNLPATSSIAVTLDGLLTETTVARAQRDQVFINGVESPIDRFTAFFDHVRKTLKTDERFAVESEVNFPVAAGLASSSSGFAALALACGQLIDPSISKQTISEMARVGSASAARSVFGGFTILKKESAFAEPLNIDWPELHIIVAIVKPEAKSLSSRKAMELSRTTSPYYDAWLKQSDRLFDEAFIALKDKDLDALGPLMQQSYLAMFSTMLTSTPPTLYWEPETLKIIKTCESIRQEGLTVWETMDAGPQVKLACLKKDLNAVLIQIQEQHPDVKLLISRAGGEPH